MQQPFNLLVNRTKFSVLISTSPLRKLMSKLTLTYLVSIKISRMSLKRKMQTPYQNIDPMIVAMISNKVQLLHTAPFIVSYKMSPKFCMNILKEILPKASSAILSPLQELPYYSSKNKMVLSSFASTIVALLYIYAFNIKSLMSHWLNP